MSVLFHGLTAAPGVGIGSAAIYHPSHFLPEHTGPDHRPEQEWERFLAAQNQVDVELGDLSDHPNSMVAEIFAAHRLILHDHTLLDAVRAAIFEQHKRAATATRRTIDDLADSFRSLEDDYFAARAADILDLGQRLLVKLGAIQSHTQLATLAPGVVLLAEDLSPSDLTALPAGHVTGLALAHSAPTAHSAILARSLGIPMICTRSRDFAPARWPDGSRGRDAWTTPDRSRRRRAGILHTNP